MDETQLGQEADSGALGLRSSSFYTRSYSTLGISALTVAGMYGIYAIAYYDDYSSGRPWYFWLSVANFASLAVVSAFSLFLSRDDEVVPLFFSDIPNLSFDTRIKILPVVTLLFISSVILACYSSGGARSSPFAHFLVAISTLSIVFAKRGRNRVFILLIAILGYVLPLSVFVSPTQALDYIRIFDWFCMVISVCFGAVAAWRVPDVV